MAAIRSQRFRTQLITFPNLATSRSVSSTAAKEEERDATEQLCHYLPVTKGADFNFQSNRPRIRLWSSISFSPYSSTGTLQARYSLSITLMNSKIYPLHVLQALRFLDSFIPRKHIIMQIPMAFKRFLYFSVQPL